MVVTLDMVFRQQGTDSNQVKFKSFLTNTRNANPTVDDWNLLMSRIDASMDGTESNTFN